MNFTNEIFLKGGIFILGVFGFLVARHIYVKKRKKQPLVCPIRFDCNTVINSDYSKFFGIPLEILGMIYYAVVFIAYGYMVYAGMILSSNIYLLLFCISGFAFLFSIYLIGVQIFALKKGCSWCIVSAIISTLIFILSWNLFSL